MTYQTRTLAVRIGVVVGALTLFFIVTAIGYRVSPVAVNVRWAPSLSDSERLGLETKYRLVDGEIITGLTWRYMLWDKRTSSLRKLVTDPNVSDTQNIDRSRMTVLRPTYVEYVAGFRWFLLLVGGVLFAFILSAGLYVIRKRAAALIEKALAGLEITGIARLLKVVRNSVLHRTGLLAAWAGIFVVALGIFFGTTAIGYWNKPVPVNVRWVPTLTDAERQKLEANYCLVEGYRLTGSTWRYMLKDTTASNVRKLVNDPKVADTHNIDRVNFVAMGSSYGEYMAGYRRLSLRVGGLLFVAMLCSVLFVYRRKIVASIGDFSVGVGASDAAHPCDVTTQGWNRAMRWGGWKVAMSPIQGMRRVGPVWFFTGTFLLLTAYGRSVEMNNPQLRGGTVYRPGVPMFDREWHIGLDMQQTIDHDVIYNNFWGSIDSAKQADVIFLGNSRAMWAFRGEGLKPYFDRYGLKFFIMTFANGHDGFPMALIQKHDLRPKYYVINADGFWEGGASRFAKRTLNRSYFQSAREVFEAHASWLVRYNHHKFFPHWPVFMFLRKDIFTMIYRSSIHGGYSFAVYPAEKKPLGGIPKVETQYQRDYIKRLREWQIPIARKWVERVREKGSGVILTFVPYNEIITYVNAQETAAALGLPLVVVWPEDLTATGTHMNTESALRYDKVFMEAFIRTKEFQRMVDEKGRSRSAATQP